MAEAEKATERKLTRKRTRSGELEASRAEWLKGEVFLLASASHIAFALCCLTRKVTSPKRIHRRPSKRYGLEETFAVKQKKPLSLVVALALACLQCKVANAEENDAYVFVEKTQFECFINHLPKYLENANETNLIFLSLCPNTNPSADDLAVAAQNSLPQIKVNNSSKHTNVLPLTKDELICIQLRGQNNNSFEWDGSFVKITFPVCT